MVTPDYYTSREACQAAGITYRCLDYWAKARLVTPTTPATGSGTRRQYTVKDVVLLAVVKRLTDMGLGLDAIRPVVEWASADDDALDMVLISDGSEVWQDDDDWYMAEDASYRIDILGVAAEVRKRLGEVAP